MSDVLVTAKLIKIPFTLVPGEKVTVWAGYKELRSQLLKIIEASRTDRVGLSEFVILYGQIGTGKSHAMRYLRNWIENENKDEFQSPVVYLESLKLGPKVDFVKIYRQIIMALNDHFIETAAWFDDLIESQLPNIGTEERAKVKDENYHDKKITPTFPQLPLLLRGIKKNDESAKKILLGDNEKSLPFRDFGLNEPLNNEFYATKVLGAYLNLCTRGPQGFGENVIPGRNKAFYFFIDEIELMLDFKPAEAVSINEGLRDLINACPENMCLIFGMTGDVRELGAILDRYVMNRMSREPIEIPSMDTEQAVTFLKEVLKSCRRDPMDPDEYPFREDALRKIAEETTEKTARRLFQTCRRVLEQAVREGRLTQNGWIEVQDVEEFMFK
jgi:Cdc6-like AAA superfamily ATPase